MASEVSAAGEDQELRRANERLERELAEAREQQSATSDILRIISNSTHDLQAVFSAIARNAVELCNAMCGGVFSYDGTLTHFMAGYRFSEEALRQLKDEYPISPRGVIRQAIMDRAVVHVADALDDPRVANLELARRLGYRSHLVVPMLEGGQAIGTINVYGAEPTLFSDAQVTLLQTFASQAVIAIENTRLFQLEQSSKRELQESLEYQTATSEVLGVISRSPHALQPVLDAIIATAARLCQADYARFRLLREGAYHVVARLSHDPDPAERHIPLRPGPDSIVGRVALERTTIHVPDVRADPTGAYALNRRLAARTVLGVPLLKQAHVVGIIMLFRDVPRAFSERQIALVETLADQAIIAIENARLFEAEQARTRELTESLEQQTATSEVLQIISSSPGELEPVFETMLENATRLCNAKFGILSLYDGRAFRNVVAHNVPPAFTDLHLGEPFSPHPNSGLAQVTRTKQLIHTEDVRTKSPYLESDPAVVAISDLAGARTILNVPMLKDDKLIGVITIFRQEVRLFTEPQIELVSNFARQAVIAIENTRLLNELRESLQQQTATADVLKVISRSTFDLQAVLGALVELASRLCDAESASIHRPQVDGYQCVASYGYSPEFQQYLRDHPITPGRGSVLGRVVTEGKIVHVPDVLADPEHAMVEQRKVGGYRTVLGVPLMRQGIAIGLIRLTRNKVQPFTDKQIELVTTFADQAVIAIENTRLFEEVQASKREMQESLEYQTATSEVLNVISRSPANVQPVLETIVETAGRLCQADHVHVYRLRDGEYHLAAHNQIDPHIVEYLAKNLIGVDQKGSVTARAARACKTVHVPDAMQDPEYGHGPLTFSNDRTVLSVPLLREGTALGVVTVGRKTLRPFTGREIELIETFADQAVIAIENTRLFEEVQARNSDLTEALEQQTATAEVLKVISRSVFDLQPVLETLIENACRLCGADKGFIYRVEGDTGQWGAAYNAAPELLDFLARSPVDRARNSVTGRVLLDRQTIHVHDVRADHEYQFVEKIGVRTTLGVPMLREGILLGVIIIYREEVRPFNERQIELVETFADQAVIAIENVRLFDEIAQKSRELEIASQHKSQFVANMSHELRTPLAAILGYAELMQEGFYGTPSQKSMDALTRIRSNGKHLLGLINTVLDIAKIESGQFSLNLGEYAVESVVETVRAATESLAETKKLSLKTDVAKKLPIGLGDEQRLTQVLLNLVGNAIKFTDAGEVRITATTTNGHFTVAVTDTGPGIPQEHQARVFEQFHQVDNSNTKAKGGTGLGLAIAKQIVEMHGGRIWVESTVGKGSTFQMELPIRAEARKAAE